MDLRDLISRNKGQEFLWTLIVEPGWVQAGVWTVVDGEAKVIAVSSPVAWDREEELVTASDTALSAAVQTLPEGAKEPNKVVFGVSASWVSEGQIKKEKLEVLRILCEKLTLKPSGFVTLPEAVSYYIKSKEGSPLTAVTITPGKELLEVSMFRLGNLLGTTLVARSVSLFEDVIEGLSRFKTTDPIPSRFILFDGKEGELTDAKQALLEGNWESATKVKILHTPKVEILSSQEKIEAVSLGGATETSGVTKVQMLESDEKPEHSLDGNGEDGEAGNVGFVVDKDISKDEESQEPDIQKENPLKAVRGVSLGVLDKPKRIVSGLFNKANIVLSGGKRPFVVGGSAFLLVAVTLSAFWWFYPKATVTIFVAPQRLDEKAIVTVKTKSQDDINFESKTLPGKKISREESGDKTTTTSGNKLVGEKAKGEVEIRNGTSDPLDLASGTILVAGNSLQFVTAKDVTIGAQSSPGSPGSGKVDVIASDIGSEFNLPKDETFKIGTYPKAEVDGKATNDFSGGTSRQIQAVSEEDRTRVGEELTQELVDKAKDELSASVSEDEYFIDGSVKSSEISKTFSGKVGDEADSLKITLTINVEGVVVTKDDLFKLADYLLKEKVPQGYVLRETQLEYDFKLTDSVQKDDVYELEGDVSANLLPEVNTEAIADVIVGKYPKVAEEYLTKIPGFVRANINISPRFPGRLGTLPRVRKNINVELAADR